MYLMPALQIYKFYTELYILQKVETRITKYSRNSLLRSQLKLVCLIFTLLTVTKPCLRKVSYLYEASHLHQ